MAADRGRGFVTLFTRSLTINVVGLPTGALANVLPVVMQLISFSAGVSALLKERWPDEHQFAFDAAPLLASREFENHMLGRWINIQIAQVTVAEAQTVTRTIRAALDDSR